MTFYFYDLETSSASPRAGRIMQFAGQRTNENLEIVGEPDNILVKLADDVIPEPDAVLVHGITPQLTLSEGMSEADFAAYFHEKIAEPNTVFVGFNNIRFDDEFMRMMCYRTLYDPYQWHWKDGRSRWDLLDPIRMMRALRPDGMKWPLLNGKPTVKLELMAKENGITHENAHDALSDVLALIQLAQTFRKAQPKLFDFLVSNRDKKSVAKLVESGSPFVYTSGRYSGEHEKTTVVTTLFKHPRRDAAIVYDLRFDPTQWQGKTPEQIITHWKPKYGEDIEKLPVKTLQYNRCPAIAPLGVLDDESKARISLDEPTIKKHRELLEQSPDLIENLKKALDSMENAQQAQFDLGDTAVDDQIYGGFWTDADLSEMVSVRMTDPESFGQVIEQLKNKRIREMVPLYKARNYPAKLTHEERDSWESFRRKQLFAGGENSRYARFSKRMQEIAVTRKLNEHEEYLLTELQLYVESIIPEPDADQS